MGALDVYDQKILTTPEFSGTGGNTSAYESIGWIKGGGKTGRKRSKSKAKKTRSRKNKASTSKKAKRFWFF